MEVEMYIDTLGNKYWHKKGIEYYYIYFHRADGPAIIYRNGVENWYYYNRRYVKEHSNKMPLELFLSYCRWEYKKLNGS